MPYTHAPETVAAIDLGSNSFHLVVARVSEGQVQMVDRLREMVRLGAGLDQNKRLTPEAQNAALACLERFGQRLRDMPPGTVRAVGTNTLRSARNAHQFLSRAEQLLGHPIDIISGIEEARLIYQGVAHTQADDGQVRLVVDIGGGSTELAVGQGYQVFDVESLYLGCVSMSQRHFPDGVITERGMRNAEVAALLEIRPLAHRLALHQWRRALGTSGTILAIAEVLRDQGWCEQGIDGAALLRLREHILAAGNVERLALPSLPEKRRPVFPGGVAILVAAFQALQIDTMVTSDGALREGLIFELLGRIEHEDIRQYTIDATARRYQIDQSQATRVKQTALALLTDLASQWSLNNEEHTNALGWAAQLHEVGLNIAHSQYHKHGAYLIENADLPGFTRQEQRLIAALVRGHRRKFPKSVFAALPAEERLAAQRLCLILRLAVRLHRARSGRPLPDLHVSAKTRSLEILFPAGWLTEHPLTKADLEEEAAFLKTSGWRLKLL